MARTLQEDLASLKIERRSPAQAVRNGKHRGEAGTRFFWALLWLIPVGVLAGAGTIAYRQYEKIRPKAEVAVAPVQAMTAGEAEKLLSAKGYIKSRHQAAIGAKVPGRVEQMFVEEGSRVKKGDELAVLEHNDLAATLESRLAQVREAEASLQEAQVDQQDKERKLKREQRLYSQNHSPAENVEAATAARDMAIARVRALEAKIKLMKSSAQEMKETIHNMHIFAPFDGTVVARESEVGETITPGGMGGASGRGSVVTLADLNHLEIETDIAENHLARVTVNQPAEIAVSAVPGRHYRGKLRQIIPMGDRARGTVKVKVEVLDPDEQLFPELVATVHFLPTKAQVEAAPTAASLFVPKVAIFEEGGHSYVWVVDRQSKLHKQRVEVVVTTSDMARVDSGLKADENVVLSPKPNLKEGEPVKIADQ